MPEPLQAPETRPVRPALAYLLLTVAAMTWGSNITIGRGVHEDIPPVALAFWRNFFALAAILLLARGHWQNARRVISENKAMFVIGGVIGVGAFNALLYTAVHSTTAINAALVMSMTPVIVPVLAFFMLDQGYSPRQGLGVALSFLGIAVMVSRADLAVLSDLAFVPGDILMLGATAAWSLYSIYVKKRPATIHPMAFLAAILAVAVIGLLPFYIRESLTVAPLPLTLTAFGAAAYVGLFPTAFALILFNRAVDSVGPSIAGHFQHLVPVFAALWAILFLGESLKLYHGIGAALIAAGIYWATSSAKTR